MTGILGALAGCAGWVERQAGAPVEERRGSAGAGDKVPEVPEVPAPRPADKPVADAAPAAPTTASLPTPAGTLLRPRARWVPVAWGELPGFGETGLAAFWPALAAGCARPAPAWNEACARVLLASPTEEPAMQQWLTTWLQPYRVESLDGQAEGLITGYFEPTVDAVRTPRAGFRVPLHAPPPELATRKPFYTRQQLDTLPAAAATLRGQEIAWVQDPLDALLLQIQGSGRLRLTEPDGRVQTVRLAYAAHNEQPYRSVGRWLVEQGELTLDGVSWPAIKAWAQRNPRRLQEMLWANPRVVFFREEPLPDPTLGPRGAAGVPLVPGRSIAVDPQAVPHGAPVWLDTTEPLSATPLRRLVMAQDSGGAITGPVRADLFWGWTREAEAQAGRMKQPLRMWVLWPRGAAQEP